jgi:hypothetical protein
MEKEEKTFDIIPYQLCPKCKGQGFVSKPPYVAGDIDTWASSDSSFACDVCNGNKIIPMQVVPPINFNLQ